MKLLTNISYNVVIFFTSIYVVDRVVAYFLKIIINISGVLQLMSYETQPPSFVNEIINISLEIGFFAIFIFFFIYIFNVSSKPINYFKESKWNKLIIYSFIIFVLMIINYAQATYLDALIGIMAQSYLLPIIWFFLFHIFNLKYLERIDANYSKFPFYGGIVFVIFLFSSMHPFVITRMTNLFN